MLRSIHCRLLVSVALFALASCGGKNAAKVSGAVTLDGKPLASGSVTFHPADGKGAIAYGQINAQGHYELTTGTEAGLTPGAYVATVVATEPVPPASPADEATFRTVTPERYGNAKTSDFKIDVKAGQNDVPLAMRSR